MEGSILPTCSTRVLRVILGFGAIAIAFAACQKAPGSPSIRIGVPYEVGTLDPHAEDKVSNEALLSNLYDSLVMLDGEMRIRPGLATSWESPDALTWTFRLRPGVTFHGGRRLRAADVVYSFKRVLGRTDLQIKNYLQDVSAVRAIDSVTVEVRTGRPVRTLLNRLSFVAILPEGMDEAALRSSADGTGPYSLAAWKEGESVRLDRNDGYWGGRPAIREAEFVLGKDPEQAIRGMLEGEYQLIQGDSKRVAAAVERSERHLVLRRDNLFVKYMAFDLARDDTPFCSLKPNPFKDLRVRRALNTAIDRHRLVSELWNYAVPATQPIPRFVFGFNPEIREVVHDREGAKTLLKSAGLDKGFRVVLHARRTLSEAAALIREDMGQIGVDVEVRILPEAQFFELMGRRGATLWLNRFGATTGDGSEFLNDVLHSTDRIRHLGMLNYGGYVNPDLDHAIQMSGEVDNAEQRRDTIQQILKRVEQDLIVIPLYSDQDVYAIDRSYAWRPRGDSHIRVAEIALREARP